MYNVVGFDANDECLYEVAVEAPNQAISWTMVLAQMCRTFATAPLADRTDKLVIRAAHDPITWSGKFNVGEEKWPTIHHPRKASRR